MLRCAGGASNSSSSSTSSSASSASAAATTTTSCRRDEALETTMAFDFGAAHGRKLVLCVARALIMYFERLWQEDGAHGSSSSSSGSSSSSSSSTNSRSNGQKPSISLTMNGISVVEFVCKHSLLFNELLYGDLSSVCFCGFSDAVVERRQCTVTTAKGTATRQTVCESIVLTYDKDETMAEKDDKTLITTR